MEAQTNYDRLTLHKFIEFERLNTLLAGILPFLMGILFAYYYFGTFNWQNTVIYMISLAALLLFVTGFNNVQDYRMSKSATYRKEQTLIGRRNLSPVTIMNVMLALLAFAALVGSWLAIRVDPVVWIIGILSFAVGIGYTYGPVPISRFAAGELLSGLFEGFGVAFLAFYINSPVKQLISLSFNWPHFSFTGDLTNLLLTFWVMLPQIVTTSAIMLANNTCDLDEDVLNNRHTLPSYIGISTSLKLFRFLTLVSYVTITISVIFKLLPVWDLLVFITLPKVNQNVKKFMKKQTKDMTFWVDKNKTEHHEPNTFDLVPQNLLLIQGMEVIGLFINIFLPITF